MGGFPGRAVPNGVHSDRAGADLAAIPPDERIKQCVKCEALIPFESVVCPHCHGKQSLEGARTCPRCSIPLHPKSLFCSGCGTLTVPTSPAPFPDSSRRGSHVNSGKYYEIWTWGIGFAALILQIGLLIDYLVLG